MVGEARTAIGAASVSGVAWRTSGRILAQRVIQMIRTTVQPRAQTPNNGNVRSGRAPAWGAIECARGAATSGGANG